MKQINRILAVCSDYEKCDRVLEVTAEMAKRHSSGVTLMFVDEPALFELPLFRGEKMLDHRKLKEELEAKAQEAGIENPAVLIYEGDTPDRVQLEAEREADSLIITPYEAEISAKIIDKVRTPVLVLKAGLHLYSRAVVVIDAVMPQRCLEFMRRFFEGVDLHLYLDFQYVPMPSVDPVAEPLDVGMDATLYTELLDAKREAFEAFCRAHDLKGSFEIGESGIDEDVAAFVRKQDADLLVLAPLDHDTILGDAIADILGSVPTDTLVCFES